MKLPELVLRERPRYMGLPSLWSMKASGPSKGGGLVPAWERMVALTSSGLPSALLGMAKPSIVLTRRREDEIYRYSSDFLYLDRVATMQEDQLLPRFGRTT